MESIYRSLIKNFLILIIISIYALSCVYGNDFVDCRKNTPLKLILRTDKFHYGVNEKIHIIVELINISNKPIYIYKFLDWGESASFSFWVKEKLSGKDVPTEFDADAPSPPPRSRDDFVELLPNQSRNLSFDSKLVNLGLRKIGKYELVSEYHSPVSVDAAYGLSVWTKDQGPIRSNAVTINIVDK